MEIAAHPAYEMFSLYQYLIFYSFSPDRILAWVLGWLIWSLTFHQQLRSYGGGCCLRLLVIDNVFSFIRICLQEVNV